MSNAGSARGLFKATGNTPKPVVVRLLDGSYEKTGMRERAAEDFYPTPPEPTRAFLHAEIERLRQFDIIWEPAAGDGAMVREMQAVGLKVYGADLVDRSAGFDVANFYDVAKGWHRAMVTNPPFAECSWGNGKARWLRHALEVLELDYMALLLPWSWPAAAGLKPFLAQHPISRVYLMTWKIDFTGQGAPPALHGWFVFDRAHQGETVLRMLDRRDPRQSELFATGGAQQCSTDQTGTALPKTSALPG